MASPLNEYHDLIDASRKINEDDNEEVKDVEDVLKHEEPKEEAEVVEEPKEEAPAEEPQEAQEEADPVEKAPAEEVAEKPEEEAAAAPEAAAPEAAPEAVVEESVNEEGAEEDRSDFQSSPGEDAGEEEGTDAEREEANDAALEEQGQAIAELLKLSKNDAGNYDTTWGEKSPKGLALTLKAEINGEAKEEPGADLAAEEEGMPEDEEVMERAGRFEDDPPVDSLDPTELQQHRTQFLNGVFEGLPETDATLLPWKRGLVVDHDELEDIFRDWVAAKHAAEMAGEKEVPSDIPLNQEPEVLAMAGKRNESVVNEGSSFHTIQKMVNSGSNNMKRRMQIKRYKSADEMHGFLNKQSNNDWRESKHDLKTGKYVYAGGEWQNVKSIDPSALAHM